MKKRGHVLSVREGKLYLDGFRLDGVKWYTINRPCDRPFQTAELFLSLYINPELNINVEDIPKQSTDCPKSIGDYLDHATQKTQ